MFKLIRMDFTKLTLSGVIGEETLRKVAVLTKLKQIHMEDIAAEIEEFTVTIFKPLLCSDSMEYVYIRDSGFWYFGDELLANILREPRLNFTVMKSGIIGFSFIKSRDREILIRFRCSQIILKLLPFVFTVEYDNFLKILYDGSESEMPDIVKKDIIAAVNGPEGLAYNAPKMIRIDK